MTVDTNNDPCSTLACLTKRKLIHLETQSCPIMLHARYSPMICFTNVPDFSSWFKRKSIVN
jgi:hypothetical protein